MFNLLGQHFSVTSVPLWSNVVVTVEAVRRSDRAKTSKFFISGLKEKSLALDFDLLRTASDLIAWLAVQERAAVNH